MKKVEFLLIQLEGFWYTDYPAVINAYDNEKAKGVDLEADLKLLEARPGKCVRLLPVWSADAGPVPGLRCAQLPLRI